jgi:hypothetical protein
MIQQTAYFRPLECPIQFGDEDSQELWLKDCAALLARMKVEGIQYATAPLCEVETRRGRIPPCTAVTAEDFRNENLASRHVLRRLINQGRIADF